MQSTPQISEEELHALVTHAQAGDSDEFGRLYNVLYDRLQSYTYKRTFDITATQDIVANSFYHMLTHIESFRWRDAAGFYAWVFRIVMNEIASYYRKDKKYALREDWLEYSETVSDDRETAEAHAEADDRAQALKRCLACLPDKLRRPLELHYFAGAPYDVIARTLGVSSGAARVRVHRGIQELERTMKGEGYEY